jgi:hypothetical protein
VEGKKAANNVHATGAAPFLSKLLPFLPDFKLTCTVALAIQEKDMKIFSFKLSLDPIATTIVPKTLIAAATTMQTTALHMMLESIVEKSICVPVRPKRMGSKMSQNTSNAIATGF